MKTLKKIDFGSILNRVPVKKAKKFVVDNLPNILSGCALASLGGAVYLTARGMHEADEIILAEEKRLEETLPDYDGTGLTLERKASLTWKQFVPAAIATTAAGLFVVASNRAGHEQYMALLGAYELSKKAFDEYREEAEDILGEEKAEEVEERAYARRAERATPMKAIGLIPNVDGSEDPTLFVESLTGTPFYASQETVLHAFNFVNHERNHWSSVSLSELLDDMGIETNQIQLAYQMVWNANTAGSELIEPRFTPAFYRGDESMPCTVIGYSIKPEFDHCF